ncbi:MAG: glycosyltransferase family 4 protein [Bacteroidota bacterium]
MRIALIHTRLLLRGGLESRLFSYMNYFHKKGHEVTVIVYKVDPEVKVPEGVKVVKINLGWTPKFARAARFDRLLGPVVKEGKFDRVISLGRTTHHDVMIVAGVHKAYLKARGWTAWKPADFYQMRMDQKAYDAPGKLLAASDMVREQMIEYHGTAASKIGILFPPTNPERFHPGHKAHKAEYRKKYSFSPNKRSFLLVSANHRLKGLPLLQQVFEDLKAHNVELLVAGGKPFPATSNVRHLGFVREIEELHAAADFGLLASQYDSFGQVVTESLLCSTPVIVSHMTGAKAIVTEKEGIVVPDFEVESWKKAILKALETDFKIPTDLAEKRGLLFDDHMETLLNA